MIHCSSCGAENMPGEIFCAQCSAVMPSTQSVPVAPATPVVPSGQPSPAPVVSGMLECRLMKSGKVTDEGFEVPEDDCELALGRPDLDEGIIPDVDLTKFGGKVTIGGELGYTFSRKQAVVSRRNGRLCLKAVGSAKTMYYLKQSKTWAVLLADEEAELSVGDRMRFGGTEGYVMFEVAQQ